MYYLDERDHNRIIEMAWEDRTPFEAIKFQFNYSESDVIVLMRQSLKKSSFKRWRARVNQGTSSKHLKKRSDEIIKKHDEIKQEIIDRAK